MDDVLTRMKEHNAILGQRAMNCVVFSSIAETIHGEERYAGKRIWRSQ